MTGLNFLKLIGVAAILFVSGVLIYAVIKSIGKSIEEEMPETMAANSFYRDNIKRILDLLLAALAIAVAAVPMVMITVAIKLDSPGPVIFKQERIGRRGKIFRILKFRSMVQNAEHTGSGVYSGKGDARVTRVGRVLRATSLDELPQLLNVIKGDMSFIGPRPPLTYHPWPLEEYTEEQLHMFDVRPGISGWAQIHGRKDVEWHHRIELNNWYVRHVTFSLDVKIFIMTISKVLMNSDNENKGATISTTITVDDDFDYSDFTKILDEEFADK